MKMIYLTSYNVNDKSNGVAKKIKSQIECIKKSGIEVDLVDINSISGGGWFKIRENISRLLSTSFVMDHLLKFVAKTFNLDEYIGIYIRKTYCTESQLQTMKNMKKKNPKFKILMEIPTYPYDSEFSNTRRKYYTIPKDMKARQKLKNVVDRIVTYSKDDKIFGIPTIRIMNSIDYALVTKRHVKEHKGINLISVSFFDVWHGYDRIIKGMLENQDLTKKYNIRLHLVGKGRSVVDYKELVKGTAIENNVIFYGKRFGKDLDEIYDISDIGIDTLARHRVGITYNSTLKGKEYLAKGLPIISGVETDLDVFGFEFYYRVPADESNVSMQDIIDFYNKIYCDGKDISKKIRCKTVKIFDFKNAFSPVINYLNKGD